MKLLLLGATGRVGLHLLRQALDAGHDVTALVRTPAKITYTHPHLTVVAGDAHDSAHLASLMAGTGAVLSTLGHSSTETPELQTAATRTILQYLKPHQRYISLTGHSVPDPLDPRHGLFGYLHKFVVSLLPGNILKDANAYTELLRCSNADWILVRAPLIVDGPATHKYRAGYLPVKLGTIATRGDLADFMLESLTSDEWLRQSPLVVTR